MQVSQRARVEKSLRGSAEKNQQTIRKTSGHSKNRHHDRCEPLARSSQRKMRRSSYRDFFICGMMYFWASTSKLTLIGAPHEYISIRRDPIDGRQKSSSTKLFFDKIHTSDKHGFAERRMIRIGTFEQIIDQMFNLERREFRSMFYRAGLGHGSRQ